MTSLELGILSRFGKDDENGVVWLDEYVDVGQRAIQRLIAGGQVQKVYAPLGRVGVRITPTGRRALACSSERAEKLRRWAEENL